MSDMATSQHMHRACTASASYTTKNMQSDLLTDTNKSHRQQLAQTLHHTTK